MTPSNDAIPADLIARAHELGEGAVALVVDAYQRGHEEGRREARSRLDEACRAHRRRLDADFVALDEAAIEALEAPFRKMAPSPIVAAYYEGAGDALESCLESAEGLGEEPPRAH